MTDQEILDELIGHRACWEKGIDECQKKLEYYKTELAKTNRLIEVFSQRINQK
jgi:hypothetical protein